MAKRLSRTIAVFASLFLGFLTVPAANADAHDQITRMDISAFVNAKGTVSVVNSFDVAYATQGHGPYLSFVVSQPYEGTDFDAGWIRKYDYDIVSVTSDTGAPTDFTQTVSNGILRVRVGDPDTLVSGTQTYNVEYTIADVMNTRNPESGLDELYWNILGGSGAGWAMEIQNLSVVIQTTPMVATATNCWMTGGVGSDDECADFHTDGPATFFHTDTLPAYGNLTVFLGFPADTFPDSPAVLRATLPGKLAWKPDPVGYGAGALSVLLAVVGAVLLARRGRDQQYAGEVPGQAPFREKDSTSTGDAAIVRKETRNPPVFFTPPQDISPALACALAREKADMRDVTATIVDLAVRNYLTITPIDGGKDFTLHLTTRPWVGLEKHETAVLNALFRSGGKAYPLVASKDGPRTVRSRWNLAAAWLMLLVIPFLILGGILTYRAPGWIWLFLVPLTLAIVCIVLGFVFAAKRRRESEATAQAHELVDSVVGPKLSIVVGQINTMLVKEGYYKKTPEKIPAWWRSLGRKMIWLALPVSLLIGLVMGYFGHAGWGLVGLGVAAFGVGCIVIAPRMPVRTPAGSAMAAQVLGFKKYLATAEADQIAWEERSDIFSRYLPYAIGFDCVDRWAKVFQEALGKGLTTATSVWYGSGGGTFNAGEFTRSMHSISESARYKPSTWSSGSGGIWSTSSGGGSSSSSSGGSGGSGSSGSSGGGSSGSGGGTW
ncbi:MAG: DUF2207 domain-containing protein [Propionibacteriaceae bacterium]|nr:DUF2207 domain-containing protein [Propionibacteriaceae bacterium]